MAVYRTLQDQRDTYPLVTITFNISMITSILCSILVPIDVYVTSVGTASLHSLTVSQEVVQHTYLVVFCALLFEIFVLVPFTFFYGEDRAQTGDVDDDVDTCERPLRALRSTIYFMLFLFVLLLGGLAVKERPQRGQEVEWFIHVLDTDHSGLRAISFAIAVMTLVGICLWTIYTAYGLVALPFEIWLGSQSVKEERRKIEEDLINLRGRHRILEMRTHKNSKETKEIETLTREENKLNALNYKLQELEDEAMSWISRLYVILVPFRWITGSIFMSLSCTIGISLSLIVIERLIHSPCGLACAYALQETKWVNPSDELFIYSSKIFPFDFVVLFVIVGYIFAASFFGITKLGIRFLCIDLCSFPYRKTSPQALLILCGVLQYILLALVMALLTLVPDYVTFGSQLSEDGTRCSMKSSKGCHYSVIASFFARIVRDIPFFSMFYFSAIWLFCIVFVLCLFYFLTTAKPRRILLDPAIIPEDEVGLLVNVA